MNIVFLPRWFTTLNTTQSDRTDCYIFLICWIVLAPIIILSELQTTHWLGALGSYFIAMSYVSIIAWLTTFVLLPNFFTLKRLPFLVICYFILCFLTALLTRWLYSDVIQHWYSQAHYITWNQIPDRMLNIARNTSGVVMALLAKQFYQSYQLLMQVEKARSEAELRLLKSQIDPHFLFNNLNVLDSLIHQDQALASEYLKHFSALYRYLLQNKDADIVPLSEEIQFVKDYIFLLESRFHQAYHFVWRVELANVERYWIIPNALQTLVENAVKHNVGSDAHPLEVLLWVRENDVIVSNLIRPKWGKVESTKTGLSNLKARYRLVVDKGIRIEYSAENNESLFKVYIPLIKPLETV